MRVIKNKCISCGGCVGVCPVDAITLTDNGAVIDPEICICCGGCMGVCPVDAITVDEEK